MVSLSMAWCCPLQVVHTDLEQAIRSFHKNYVVLRAFLADATDKIKTMHTDMSQVRPVLVLNIPYHTLVTFGYICF